MVAEQMVDIPADHRLIINVPPEVPTGPVILTFTSKATENSRYSTGWQETLAVLERTKGAWAANPWLTGLEDIRAARDVCAERDPWNDYPAPENSGGNG